MAELIGSVGYLSVATRGTEGPGEVVLPNKSLVAWSKEPLRKGHPVLITALRDTREVSVEPIDL